MSLDQLKAWFMAKYLPTGQVDLPIAQVKRIARVVHALALLAIPFYQLDRALRAKFKRRLLPVSTLRSDLMLMAAKYMGLLAQYRELQDEHGFIMSNEGDSLLFSGLAGASGVRVDIAAARDESGQWFRRPIDNPLTDQASTISRDMLIGLLWYCWRNKRLDLLEDLWTYGVANNWVMGQGDASRICMLPALQGTLALMIAKLGGKKHIARWNPQLWSTNVVGYEAHLSILHIALMGEIEGQVDGSMMNALTIQANRQPENPLFTAALARYTGSAETMALAEQSLDNDHWWPTDRLPREDDRSEPWLPQRDLGTDWAPGPGTRQWTGCDFIFCLGI